MGLLACMALRHGCHVCGGEEQRTRQVHARAASRAAMIRDGKLYVGTEHPEAKMNLVLPA